MTLADRRTVLLEQRVALLAYAVMKLKAATDLHAVADAAMDIRDLDAKLELLADLMGAA